MNLKSLSLIIPNHNGGRVIEPSVREYYNVFAPKFKDFEIIVVCNGCTDNSVEICKRLERQFPLRTIEIPQRGKGYALIRGFNEAVFEIFGFLDADNPFDLEKINEMIEHLRENHVVIASKYTKGNARLQDSQLRRIISLGGGAVSRILFGLKVADTQAGAKFFRREVWERINRNFVCKGFDFDIEFLYKAKKSKAKIKEIYTPFRYEQFSTVRLKYLPGMLKRLFKLRFLK